jgi:NAD(P)-dependent dehydrogenase (short-subunit alcohol dehydrogenase family)
MPGATLGAVPLTSLKDRIAVVTGGASGIGRALALLFAREGAHVVVADLDEAGMAETVAGVIQAGRRGLAVKTDVSHLADVQALADRAFAELGAVHVVCNNAGVALWGGLESVSHQDWEWAMGVNLWGVIHGVEAFVPRMVAQKQPGHVVNTASMAGLIASQGLGVYNTTKYAVVGLSETLQKDLRGHDIGVSVLCPMGVNTRIRQSERNRPATLRNATAAREGAPAAREGTAVELIGRYLPPEHVAERVLRAIYANRLYVITHEEGLTPLKRRFERMAQAIEENK